MKRVLLVTYYFPPAGGMAVQRPLALARYLRGFGFEPTVLTLADGAYPERDTGLLDRVPPDVEVVRTDAFDPFTLYGKLTGKRREEAMPLGHLGPPKGAMDRLARWVRGNVFLPDARVGWVPYAVRAARRLTRTKTFDAVLTTGPPHSLHLIGRALHRRPGLPWVADFRDPWTGISYYHQLPMSKAARRLDAALERRVLRAATRITTVSAAWRTMLAEKGGRALDDVTLVHNGFDEEAFGAIDRTAWRRKDVFELAHVGSLYGSRNPVALWDALARLRGGAALPRLRLRLVGTVGEEVRADLAARGLDAVLDWTPRLPHTEAIPAMGHATALILSIEAYQNEQGNMTGKLYEYLGAGRPVVGVGPPAGEAAQLLEATGGGRLFARDDVDGLARHLRALYDRWAAGEDVPGASPEAARPYGRRAQTGAMARVLEAAIGAEGEKGADPANARGGRA